MAIRSNCARLIIFYHQTRYPHKSRLWKGKMTYPKVVFVGSTNVGKTSIVSCQQEHIFADLDAKKPTIGAANSMISVPLNGRNINLDVWDTAGQERYRSLTPMYFTNCAVCVMVYDITCYESFEALQDFLPIIDSRARDAAIVLVGNKNDQEDNRRVDLDEANEFANQHSCAFFLETSAKTGACISELFTKIAELTISKPVPTPLPPQPQQNCC